MRLSVTRPAKPKAPPLRVRLIIAVTLVVLALAWWLSAGRGVVDAAVIGSGTIEGQEVTLTAEVGGRVDKLAVKEGDEISTGLQIIAFDSAALQAQCDQAAAAVDVARANLALLEKGARPEEIRQAEAAVTQAAALRDAAKKAWDNAVAMRNNPQDLVARINAARPQVSAAEARLAALRKWPDSADLAAAEAAVAQARANLSTAEQRLEQLKKGPRPEDVAILKLAVEQARNTLWATQIERDGIKGNPLAPDYQKAAADARVAAAETAVSVANANLAARTAPATQEELLIATNAVDAARAALSGAEARLAQLKAGPKAEDLAVAEANLVQAHQTLKDLLAMKDNPLALDAQVDATRGQYEAAEAALKSAQARLEILRNGPTAEQVEVARAQVRQAEAAARTLQAQLDKATVRSPINGLVARLNVKAGETVTPGMRLATVTDIGVVNLVVYVPETKIGLVKLGQKVEVSVDSFPGQTFSGEVVYISSQAEYTPRNVQSPKERANTVFAVKVQIPNPDLRLKPGMPADARFHTG